MSASIYTLLVINNPTVSNVILLLIQCTINNRYSVKLKNNNLETGNTGKEGCTREDQPQSNNIKINFSCLPIDHNRNQVTTR
jgi:hypothetical protein